MQIWSRCQALRTA